MELIIIAILTIILVIILGYLFNYNIKKIKQIADNKELDELAEKYPRNIELCKAYLGKLGNNTVKIEENNDYLDKESIIKVMLYYAGGNYDFYLSDITYYYSNGLEKRSESKEYDLTLFENGATGGEIAIPLSDFENRSPISKVDLEFYSENEMDYVGGTVFFTGVLPMTESNILNVGDAMVANGNNTATISVYLEHYLAFDVNAAIQMVCYWAPAKLLKLTKVTLYTDVVVIPA